MFKKMMRLAVVLALFVATGMMARAQSATDGAIGGTVEDATASVVSGATVVVQNNGTNAVQTVVSDGSGFFRVIHLQPGTYTVTVTASGFDTFKSSSTVVEVGLLTNVEAKLKIGSSATTVEVSSEDPAINTTSPDFANTIDQKVLQDLPVNNYRWSAYALLTPGVVEGGGFGLLSFRGQSTLLNNVTFDGADDNQAFFSEERGRTRVGYSTAKASIQEFQVNTSNYSVEYGRSAGGVVNAVTKSGTNQIHGEMYFYDRDAGWGALNRFTTHAVQTSATPLTYQSKVFNPKDWRKQMGVGIGGPIIKDKVFFFFAFDKFLRNFPGISAPGNPNLFYNLPKPGFYAAQGACALTSTATAEGATCLLASQLSKIPGATVPAQVAQVTAAQYATAYAAYTSGIQGLNALTGLTPRIGDQDIFFPKLDWQINGRNHATVEMNRLRWTSPAGIQTSTSALQYGIASFGNDYVKDTFLIGKLDTAITPALSNEIRYQYGRDFEFETPQTPTSYETSTLLTPPGYTNPYGIPPNVNITNAFQFGTATFLTRPAFPDERRYQITDTVNVVKGNHNLKFGLDFLHTNDLSQNLFAQFGGYSYGGSNYAPFEAYFADLNTTNGCGITHNIECYTGYTQGFGPLGFEFQTKDYAAFAQDEWKVNPRLSLTLGVRYEYEAFPQPQIPNTNEAASPFVNGSTTVFPSNKGNIGPRVGFAFDVFGTGKTAVRGGAGEFFARAINATIYSAISQTGNSKGQLSTSPANSGAGGPTFPKIIDPTTFNPTGATAVYYFDKNFKLPEILQADLTVEQDLGWNSTFSLTWLAAFGRRLPDFVDTNLPKANGTVSYTVMDSTGKGPVPNGTVVKIPFYAKLPGSANGRPNPAYGPTTDIFSGVNSNYEALVASVQHRFTHHLAFSANYTFSHALDYGENNNTSPSTNLLVDPGNLRLDYGNSNQNVPNRIVANAIYETPSPYKGILGLLLNQYEISPSFQAQNGNPYAAFVSGSTGLSSTGLAGVSFSPNGSGGAARLPTLDRNLLQLPRVMLLDMRLSKRFNVRDKAHIELLGEAFNIANHFNFTAVNTTAYGSTVGTATTPNLLTYNATYGIPNSGNNNFIYTVRQIQLGARVQF